MHWLPLAPGDTLGTHFFWGLSHSVAIRNKSLKNPYDPNGNWTRTHLACSAISQPTAPMCTPLICPQNSQYSKKQFKVHLAQGHYNVHISCHWTLSWVMDPFLTLMPYRHLKNVPWFAPRSAKWPHPSRTCDQNFMYLSIFPHVLYTTQYNHTDWIKQCTAGLRTQTPYTVYLS
jgi:hypothetical protein